LARARSLSSAVGAISAMCVNSCAPAPSKCESARRRSQARQPEFGVSPGQAAALYDDDRLLGGGWIEERVPAGLSLAT
jgi:tRNA-specific 2-thiouridylase